MRIDQTMLYLGILFSRQKAYSPLSEEDIKCLESERIVNPIRDYKESAEKVTKIISDASKLMSMQTSEAVQTCTRIRVQINSLIKITEMAIAQVEEKEKALKAKILDNSSDYACTFRANA